MHDKGEVPTMRNLGFSVAPGTHTLVAVKKYKVIIIFSFFVNNTQYIDHFHILRHVWQVCNCLRYSKNKINVIRVGCWLGMLIQGD